MKGLKRRPRVIKKQQDGGLVYDSKLHELDWTDEPANKIEEKNSSNGNKGVGETNGRVEDGVAEVWLDEAAPSIGDRDKAEALVSRRTAAPEPVVYTGDIADSAVTDVKIANFAISGEKIRPNSICSEVLGGTGVTGHGQLLTAHCYNNSKSIAAGSQGTEIGTPHP